MRKGLKILFGALIAIGSFGLVPKMAEARLCGQTAANTSGVQRDLWDNGGRIIYPASGVPTCTATELAQDYLGNFLPTTNNVQSLGTSSLQWSDVESNAYNSAGGSAIFGSLSLTVNNNAFGINGTSSFGTVGTANLPAGNGNATAPTQFKVVGSLVFPATQIGNNGTVGGGIYVSTTIPVLSTYETLTSSATNSGLITITATPSISTLTVVSTGASLPDGTYLILGSTAPTNGGGILLQDNGTLAGSKLHLGAATRQVGPDKVLTLIWEAVSGFWEEVSYASNN